MKTRTIYGPLGSFHIPADGEVSRHSEACCMGVFNGEYLYERDRPETVRYLLDLGCNCGAFLHWAKWWWPALKHAHLIDPNIEALGICDLNCEALDIISTVEWAAVTSAPMPIYFKVIDNWGGSKTMNEMDGMTVLRVLPSDLPPCDVLKIDTEGTELEILSDYPHLHSVQILLYEYHNAEYKDPLAKICRDSGMVPAPGRSEESWVKVWIRNDSSS